LAIALERRFDCRGDDLVDVNAHLCLPLGSR
jgi:hypothetical protein